MLTRATTPVNVTCWQPERQTERHEIEETKLVQAVTIGTCIWEASRSYLSWDNDNSGYDYSWLSSVLHVKCYRSNL